MLAGHGRRRRALVHARGRPDDVDGLRRPSRSRSPASSRKRNPSPSELTGEWKRLLPESAYQHEDDGVGEHPPDGWTNTFPHPLTQTRTDGRVMSYWQSTPAADAFLAPPRPWPRSTS